MIQFKKKKNHLRFRSDGNPTSISIVLYLTRLMSSTRNGGNSRAKSASFLSCARAAADAPKNSEESEKEMGELSASLQLPLKDIARMLAQERGMIILHWYHMAKSLNFFFPREQIRIFTGTLVEHL